MDKFQAEAVFCQGGTKCEDKHVSGTWSTIYDQSFMVELENGIRFVANFKYSVKPEISETPANDVYSKFENLKTGDYNKFLS
jgi:Cathepsin C exclusion domain